MIDVINEACAPAGGGAQQGTGATSAIAHDVKARQLAALNALLADLHRRGDFEEASKVRAAIERLDDAGLQSAARYAVSAWLEVQAALSPALRAFLQQPSAAVA